MQHCRTGVCGDHNDRIIDACCRHVMRQRGTLCCSTQQLESRHGVGLQAQPGRACTQHRAGDGRAVGAGCGARGPCPPSSLVPLCSTTIQLPQSHYHKHPPDSISSFDRLSKTDTSAPASRRARAATSPATPAPTTTARSFKGGPEGFTGALLRAPEAWTEGAWAAIATEVCPEGEAHWTVSAYCFANPRLRGSIEKMRG